MNSFLQMVPQKIFFRKYLFKRFYMVLNQHVIELTYVKIGFVVALAGFYAYSNHQCNGLNQINKDKMERYVSLVLAIQKSITH